MSKKKSEIEKSTRRIIEATSEMIRVKNGKLKWKKKLKKKKIRLAQISCFHWRTTSKGGDRPALFEDPDRPGYWKCDICKRSFPIIPLKPTEDNPEPYTVKIDEMLEYVNQIAFWSVKLGGNARDTETFLRLKTELERFKKVAKNVSRRVRKNSDAENRRNNDVESQFNAWASFGYRRN